ncbi:hypothetical protein J4573_49360 [Actinomadura barringtoniae]|uniref:Uncharacterized protein n=1 Tax=Actinomadura barringtoniae TaxID=1427535 RepID=A0A939PLJ2_9ACTN|nr:hypothetical protein [Actinomadura barringtoniae]MBO2455172.1 hypothetical protein [Actinomadura barringtoniae]
MRRSDRIAWWAFGIGIVAILGGVQAVGMLDDPAPPQSPSPASVDQFCPPEPVGKARSDTYFNRIAEPYRGKGPHAVSLRFADADTGDYSEGLPARWEANETGVKPKPQLVACAYQDTAGSRETRVCEYVPESTARLYSQLAGSTRPKNTTKISLMKASYLFEIYEAKTAKPLGRFQIPGDHACPKTVKLDDRALIGQAPDAVELHNALRPYAERTLN